MSEEIRKKIPVYSLYANEGHSPLALGMLISYAVAHDNGRLNDTFVFIPELLSSLEKAYEIVARHGNGVLLCSDYWWTANSNHKIAKKLKDRFPGTIAIHGGPSVPKYDYALDSFFDQNECADIMVRGEGEIALAEILDKLASPEAAGGQQLEVLASIAGIAYRTRSSGGQSVIVRTPDRPRVANLEELPSPYLSGWFTSVDASGWLAAIVETNRGCPYGCTFCDWGSATLSKIRGFGMDRIQRELEWIGAHKIDVLWIADANFGIWPRDLEIASIIATVRRRYGYPREVVVNYAKHATERIADIVKVLCDAQVSANAIIALQTQDPTTLRAVKRDNISTRRYEDLIRVFRGLNLPVSSDLMIGLPGATIESFKADLQFCFDRQVYAQIHPTFVLPNSPMGHRDYLSEHLIRTDDDGRILSTSTYSDDDRLIMERIRDTYQMLVGYGMLRYVLYYVQIEYQVKAIECISTIQGEAVQHGGQMPITERLLRATRSWRNWRHWEWDMYRWSEEKWQAWFQEILTLLGRRFGVATDSAMRSIVTAQIAIMPRMDRVLPARVSLEHDVARYFQDLRECDDVGVSLNLHHRRLLDSGPSDLVVRDDEGISSQIDDRSKFKYGVHRILWELDSPLRSGIGVAHFVDLPPELRTTVAEPSR